MRNIPPAEELVERRDEEMADATAAPKKTDKELKEIERAKEKFVSCLIFACVAWE